MPRKARPRAASDVASSNVRETQQRRTSSSRPKLEESPTDESDVFGATSSLILEADPTGKRGYLRVPAKAVSPKFDVRPIADDVGHGDAGIPELPRNHARQPAIEENIPENSGDVDLPQPRSAWFVFGSDESLLTDDDLEESAGRVRWNGSKHAEIGDIAFFYYIAPEQAIHFVARVASQPVQELWNRGGSQWWADYDSMIRIEPIHLSEIRETFGEERLLVYARGGMYIRPDFANRLIEKARPKFWISMRDADNVLCGVVGRKELGEPNTITLDGLRELESADFTFEAEVEYHLLEPLLRIAGVYGQAEVVRKWDLPDNLTADYAVLDSGRRVLCIIEAKLNLGKLGNWQTNRHVKQAREYAKMCKPPGFVVMDRDRVVCFRTPDELPCLVLDRATLDENGLSALRAHILNENTARRIDLQGLPTSKTNQRRRGRDE